MRVMHWVKIGLLCCVSGSALAASELTAAMPEALKGIPPSGLSCQRDDVQRGAKGQPLAPIARRGADLSCMLEPAQWPSFAGKKTPLMVDIRSAAEFEAAHVDGALNASVVQLKVKPYLKDRAVVLMGSGKAEEELYMACADLKAQGFAQVRVMRGGMARWKGLGKDLVGRTGADAGVPELKAAELWQEQQFEANLVLVAPSHASLMAQLPSAIAVSALTAQAVQAVVERRRKETRNAPLAAVVIVGDATEPQLRALASALPSVPLLSYAAPASSYLAEMRQQQAAWTALAKGPKQLPCGR
ncbi:rhodanese-like domain-containing protein [Roseateles sp. SL47]|uniref:rhodanese-like domain-containing protein n=1 Tax=Roseateles sp. SL47 TaxID=2995138 RepID=UPI00226E354B|nr:rhodanese-like domain-containing protein [Roseateles sp. SL47]WAC71453.1 rhodanese-like domain-containing protein [Roseateles sp. SL47]